MQAVNVLTQYFLKKLLKVEEELDGKPNNKTLIDVYDGTHKAAVENGMSTEQASTEAERTSAIAVQMNLTFNLHSLIKAAAAAGKVLCEIADPETVGTVKELMSPEELRTSARQAACDVTNLLITLNELLPLVDKMIDTEFVAERLLVAARKRREERTAPPAEPGAKAKPVTGEVTLFAKRTTPSQN